MAVFAVDVPEAAATIVGTRHFGVVVAPKTVVVAVLRTVTTLRDV